MSHLKKLQTELADLKEAVLSLRQSRRSVSLEDGLSDMETLLGFGLHDWQRELVLSDSPKIICKSSRQSGKSVSVAVRTALRMVTFPGSEYCIISPTARQSNLLHEKIRSLVRDYVRQDTATKLVLTNGSQVLSLPGDRPSTIRGASGDLIFDEVAFIKSNLIEAALPIAAARGGRILLISTPNGQGNFFHETWENAEQESWEKYNITLANCGHYTAEALQTMRDRLGERRWRQEMETEFLAPMGAAFDAVLLEEAFSSFSTFEAEPDHGAELLKGFKQWQ